MKIQEFNPEDDSASLLKFYELFDAASRFDDPNGPQVSNFRELLPRLASPVRGLLGGGRSFGGWWSRNFDGHLQQIALATDTTGEVLGAYLIELPRVDNTDVAFCSVIVSPSHRRRGIGRQLFEVCARRIANADRKVIIGYVRDGSSGSSFMQVIGAKPAGTTDVRRVLEIDADFERRLPALRDSEKAGGYSLVSWEGSVPEKYLDDLVVLYNAMVDAPRPDVMAAEQWNRQRVRENEATERELTTLHVAARHDASGELVAYSTIVIDPILPDWGFQNATVVTRPHRGRALGLFTKVGLHEWLIESYPSAKRVMTTNDETNKYIIAVNEQFGFRVTDSFTSWEIALG